MRYLFLFLLAAIGVSTGAGAQSEARMITFEGHQFQITGGEASVGEFLGRDALFLANTQAWFADTNFSDGVVEFDIAFQDAFGFTGLMFRAADRNRLEYFYLRTAKSGEYDALQYAPVENRNTAWQLFWDGNALQQASFVHDGWNHVRLVVIGDRADLFINGSTTPTLHIPDLMTDIRAGGIGFVANFDPSIRISNVSVRSLQPGDQIIGTAAVETAIPDGTLTDWSVSTVFPENSVDGVLTMPSDRLNSVGWDGLDPETNGMTNVSRLRARSPENDTVFLSTRVTSQGDRTALMRFGYADRARIFVNGTLLFHGNATYNSRHPGFLGLIGLNDAITVPLIDGDNEIVVALSETFGGWGWIAAIEDRDGISFSAPRTRGETSD